MRGAVLVAGGASRRMGRDKATLKWEGTPLVLHMIEILRPAVNEVVVAAARGQELGELPPGIHRVDDPAQSGPGGPIGCGAGGPLVGVEQGLRRLDELGVGSAYLASVDMPLLRTAHVAFMLDRLSKVAAAVPVVGGVRQPLAAALRVRPALAVLPSMHQAQERALVRLFDRIQPREELDEEALPDAGCLRDADTPGEWDALTSR